ncbi:hypothetical protein D3C83_173130 [compost metagenome]
MSWSNPASATVSTVLSSNPSAAANLAANRETRSECPRVYGSFASTADVSARTPAR